MKRKTDTTLLLLRISIGLMMLLHGISKIGALTFIEILLESKGMPSFMAYGVYVGEIIAPIMLIVGFRTRLASILFTINVLTAMLLAHSDQIFSLNEFGGWAIELLGLYLAVALALMASGGGKYAISTRSRWD